MTEQQEAREKQRDKHFMEMAKRFDEVPGFRKEFNKRFKVEAAKHPMGTVDTETLSQTILKEMNVKDPVVQQ